MPHQISYAVACLCYVGLFPLIFKDFFAFLYLCIPDQKWRSSWLAFWLQQSESQVNKPFIPSFTKCKQEKWIYTVSILHIPWGFCRNYVPGRFHSPKTCHLPRITLFTNPKILSQRGISATSVTQLPACNVEKPSCKHVGCKESCLLYVLLMHINQVKNPLLFFHCCHTVGGIPFVCLPLPAPQVHAYCYFPSKCILE